MNTHKRFALLFALSTISVVGANAFANEEGHEWEGLYSGIMFGNLAGTSRRNFDNGNTTGDFGVHGILGGALLGFNAQFDELVFGVEANIALSEVDGHEDGQPDRSFAYYTRSHWQAMLGPR